MSQTADFLAYASGYMSKVNTILRSPRVEENNPRQAPSAHGAIEFAV
jgi:hypothetical protein